MALLSPELFSVSEKFNLSLQRTFSPSSLEVRTVHSLFSATGWLTADWLHLPLRLPVLHILACLLVRISKMEFKNVFVLSTLRTVQSTQTSKYFCDTIVASDCPLFSERTRIALSLVRGQGLPLTVITSALPLLMTSHPSFAHYRLLCTQCRLSVDHHLSWVTAVFSTLPVPTKICGHVKQSKPIRDSERQPTSIVRFEYLFRASCPRFSVQLSLLSSHTNRQLPQTFWQVSGAGRQAYLVHCSTILSLTPPYICACFAGWFRFRLDKRGLHCTAANWQELSQVQGGHWQWQSLLSRPIPFWAQIAAEALFILSFAVCPSRHTLTHQSFPVCAKY